MNYFGCSIVRHYLPFGKTCLTFVIFFIKILKAKKIKQHFSMCSISFCGTIDHLIEDNRLILIIFKNCRWLVDSFLIVIRFLSFSEGFLLRQSFLSHKTCENVILS